MAYGHAERNLALLRQLEAETRQLLESLDQPDPEQSAWLAEVTSRGDARSVLPSQDGPRPARQSRDRGARAEASRLRAASSRSASRHPSAGRGPRRAGRAADRRGEVGDLRAGG